MNRDNAALVPKYEHAWGAAEKAHSVCTLSGILYALRAEGSRTPLGDSPQLALIGLVLCSMPSCPQAVSLIPLNNHLLMPMSVNALHSSSN